MKRGYREASSIDILPQQRQALPHSNEAERAVLGAILLAPEILETLAGRLDASDFYTERHQLLFRALLDLKDGGLGVDLRTLQALLEDRGQLETIGGLAYLTGLDLDLPDISRTEVYADIVRERATRRRLIQLAGEMIRSSLDGEKPALEVAGDAAAGLAKIVDAEVSSGGDFLPFGDALHGFLVGVEEFRRPEGVVTGIKRLDDLVGPAEPGKLVFVGGRAGMGKTAFMVQMVAQEFIHGRKGAIVSLEQPCRDIASRFLSHVLSIDEKSIKGRLSSRQWAMVTLLRAEVARRGSLFIDDECVRHYHEIAARVRKLHRVNGIDSVFVDYLTLIRRERSRSAHEEIEEVSYDLQRLAKQLEITIVVMAQLNRSASRDNRPPQMHDFREAGEQAPHRAILLHRFSNPSSDGECDDDHGQPDCSEWGTVNVAKNKDGRAARIRTYYDGRRLRWWDGREWEAGDHDRPLWKPPGRDWE